MTAVLVVSGLPATGKTTLARRISRDLSLPAFLKDDLKEALMDRLGWEDRQFVDRLSLSTWDLLFRIVEANLKAGVDCLVEANFRTESRQYFLDLRRDYGARMLEVNCRASGKVILQRVERRIEAGERHPGHQDWKVFELGVEGLEAAAEVARHCLDLPDGCITVEASDFARLDYEALLADVKSRLRGS